MYFDYGHAETEKQEKHLLSASFTLMTPPPLRHISHTIEKLCEDEHLNLFS